MKYVGVDIGGMSVKVGIVDEYGRILFKQSEPCYPDRHESQIVASIAALINDTINKFCTEKDEIGGIGIGCPGSVYDQEGIVRYSCNLNFRNTPLADLMSEMTGISNVRLSNDANCAALGETLFGAGEGAMNSVTVTLGTGVGTGIIVDGRLITGNKSAGAEGGHMIIEVDGRKCGCGNKGCYEMYASATALIAETRASIGRHPDSILAQVAEENGLDGKTAFEAKRRGCPFAKRVVNKYVKYVSTGIINLANIFYPEVVIIGGGISNEGDDLLRLVRRYVLRHVYGSGWYSPKMKVTLATLKNDAGIVGAAALCMPNCWKLDE